MSGELIFGLEPVRELLAVNPKLVRVLYLRARDQRRFASEAVRVKEAGGEVRVVEEAELQRAAGSQARHQGLVASVRPYQYLTTADLIEAGPELIVLIDGVTDPRNLGAILRVVECAGFKAVIIARDHTAQLSAVAIKASAGAWVHLRLAQCGNVVRTLEELQQAGYWIAVLTPEGEQTLEELDVQRRLVVVIGAEGAGVRPLVKKRADFGLRIPLYGKLKSLNVAVASGVALFSIRRRREGLFGALVNAL
ncbi:MAG TPA: 23S rRNA (guanosine(2251)-2'-O)-methyltransferase RlmB [Candidatus Binataceae bacterium]|nr:23S rRNA (guanosine(2251)-2'-O)-methyltransferase RlmB [Candidatus Binataceae bacterium]